MIFNKSSSLLSNNVILSSVNVLRPINNFLFSNYYSLDNNYFNNNNNNIMVLKDIKCDIKIYSNRFNFDDGAIFPSLRLIVERNGSIITIFEHTFTFISDVIIKLNDVEFKKDDIIRCYADRGASPSYFRNYSIGGYSLFLKEQ